MNKMAWLLSSTLIVFSSIHAKPAEFVLNRGVNISHWLSQSGRRGEARQAFFTDKDMVRIAGLGYDHIRLPVDEEQLWDESGKRHDDAFELLHKAIGWARANKLRVVVDLHILRSHHFNAREKPLWTDPKAQARFASLWADLSAALKKYPVTLVAYELMNEPVADDPEDWNRLVAKLVRIIRKNEPHRKIVIGSNRWQSPHTFDKLRIPEGDRHIILSFHFYTPMLITHYKASWTGVGRYKGPVNYPGQLVTEKAMAKLPKDQAALVKRSNGVYNRKVMEKMLAKPLALAKRLDLPLYCGEWGCYKAAPRQARLAWYADVRAMLEDNGIAWANWDYKGGFAILDREGKPDQALLDVLLPPKTRHAPIALHPDNPHYFLWRGKPTILITSGEHYGALLNLDFDYRRYFDTLARDGMNNTRTFMGAYVETDGNFNIARNTLNPAKGRFICPWARSNTPGYADGGNKFDLTGWDPAYFKRLHDFVGYASQKGIVVEITLFCPMYNDTMWSVCPMNIKNNVNGWGAINRKQVLTLDKNGKLLAVQEAMTRKIVRELRGYDNIYFEICNEPYFGGADDWQRRMADVIVEAMADFPQKFLISQNIANKKAKVVNPHPAISIFNFHYAAPPDTVAMNYHLNKVIGDNETGFRGTGNKPYRREAWDFIIAGGGLFNHLDYSFVAGHEDGTFKYPAKQPGGGNAKLRAEFRRLRDFINSFDFVRMKPDNAVIKGGVPKKGTARALVEKGKQYALYITGEMKKCTLALNLPAGTYRAVWLDPISGEKTSPENFKHPGGVKKLASPACNGELALKVVGSKSDR